MSQNYLAANDQVPPGRSEPDFSLLSSLSGFQPVSGTGSFERPRRTDMDPEGATFLTGDGLIRFPRRRFGSIGVGAAEVDDDMYHAPVDNLGIGGVSSGSGSPPEANKNMQHWGINPDSPDDSSGGRVEAKTMLDGETPSSRE